MAEEDDSPQFLEVTCRTSGKTLRFAPGTDAGFAVALINRKLKGTVPIATHIEAVKDGKEEEEEEETIAFGPSAILSNFGHNWKLQTVLSSGSGKKTLIMALLRLMFGPGAEKVKVENRTWKVDAGSRSIDLELTTLSSANHIEMTPSDAGFQDRYIVQEIIKEMAKNRPIDAKGKKGFKVLVLNDVDKLSREAQHSLRRTMEKYSAYCRLILCCNSSSRVTEAIRSRCLNVRINAPSEEQIVEVLQFIGKKEGLQLPSGFAARIAEKSNRNLRRAILSFETCRVQQYPFTDKQTIPPMDWEEYISEIASDIMKEQSPKRLFQVRGKLYELLINCIPPEIILKRLLYELLRKLDAELKHEVCHWAAYYEHRMRLGQKAIFHIEAFVAKFMSIYKSFLIATFG